MKELEIESNTGVSITPFALGFAAGVIGTLLFATYYEDQFKRVVWRTRQIGEKAANMAGEVKSRVVETVHTLSDGAEDQIDRVKQSAHHAMDTTRDEAADVAGKVSKGAKRLEHQLRP